MHTYFPDERDRCVAAVAARFADYERRNDATMRREMERAGIEIACDGRSVAGGEKAWKRAVSKARRKTTR